MNSRRKRAELIENASRLEKALLRSMINFPNRQLGISICVIRVSAL